MDEIIAQLFNVRSIAHRLHLGTRSFAKHIALGDFYTDIGEKADELAEIFQGKHGLLDIKSVADKFDDKDPVTFINSVAAWAESVHKDLNPADAFVVNKWEEIQATIYRTKYKLDNLA